MDNLELRDKIIDNLTRKSNLQQKIFDNTFTVLNELKEILHEISSDLNDDLDDILDRRVRIEYRDRGKYEAQIQVASDIIIFSMHTNIFEFSREHPVWQNPYAAQNRENTYCGVINIYNFLSDSFKYNRNSDTGYLIGRIFVNREMQYFAEGKRQTSLRFDNFGTKQIDKTALVDIIEAAVDYSINFDLLVPPFETVKEILVEQLNTRMEHSKIHTAKRLGYEYRTDDI